MTAARRSPWGTPVVLDMWRGDLFGKDGLGGAPLYMAASRLVDAVCSRLVEQHVANTVQGRAARRIGPIALGETAIHPELPPPVIW